MIILQVGPQHSCLRCLLTEKKYAKKTDTEFIKWSQQTTNFHNKRLTRIRRAFWDSTAKFQLCYLVCPNRPIHLKYYRPPLIKTFLQDLILFYENWLFGDYIQCPFYLYIFFLSLHTRDNSVGHAKNNLVEIYILFCGVIISLWSD